jgi:hypothetical protein
VRLVTLGVGAQNSPRYAPAGLLVAHGGVRVMIDGGPGAVPSAGLDAWLVTDMRSELIAADPDAGSGPGPATLRGALRATRPSHHRARGRPHQSPDVRLPDRGGRAEGRVGAGVLRVPTMGARRGCHVRGGGGMESPDPLRRWCRWPPRRSGRRPSGEAPRCPAAGLRAYRPTDPAGARPRFSAGVRGVREGWPGLRVLAKTCLALTREV